VVMNSTAKAIVLLRQQMGLSQAQLAALLSVTPGSVTRYENGAAPRREVIRKLAGLGALAQIDSVVSLFLQQRRVDVEASYKGRQSSGTGRHVPVRDLRIWHAHLGAILDRLNKGDRDSIADAQHRADWLKRDLEIYIGRPSHTRPDDDPNRIVHDDEALLAMDRHAWQPKESAAAQRIPVPDLKPKRKITVTEGP
jgi:transcriptional regulator with XRE-family HTH domain